MRNVSYNVIDYIRFVLIVVVILCHIVNFGHVYPSLQNAMAVIVMPAFLMVTGYLVNVDKDWKSFALYLMRIILPYVIMSLGYAVASLYLPVRYGVADGRPVTLLRMLLVEPIGPYWFLHTMAVCAILYYVARRVFSRYGVYPVLVVFACLLIIVSQYVGLVSFRFAVCYFIGVGARTFSGAFSDFFRLSALALAPFLVLLADVTLLENDIVVVVQAYCVISFIGFCTGYAGRLGERFVNVIGFIGRNTLPVYIFHPVFTMAGKYLLPLFRFDPTGLLHALVTVIMCVAGSLAVAYAMDKLRLSYCFGRRRILR